MAFLSISTYLKMLTLLIFHFKMLSADRSLDFSLERFDTDPSFEHNFALYGDAKGVVDNGTKLLQLTDSASSSVGRVMYKKPIKLVEGNPRDFVSFSTSFSFMMSADNGDGLAFVMVPSVFNVSMFESSPFGVYLGSDRNGHNKIVAVEFDTVKDAKYGDSDGNHVGIDIGGFVSVKTRNVSSIDMVLNSGKRLHSWIDFEAGLKRLEVRLSHSGDRKPADPLLWYTIDLPEMWSDDNVFIGLSSSNKNSSQTCFIYSWSFKLRRVPHWMHSQPLDPQAFAKSAKPIALQKKSDCFWRMVAGMVFGAACGALGAVSVLYLWTIFGNRRPVVPEDCSSVHPVDFEYKKVKVVVDKAVEDGKQKMFQVGFIG